MKIDKNSITGIVAIVLFFILIVLIKCFDVAAIGPEGTEVGFSHLNGSFHELFPYNETIYKLTEILGYLALLIAGCFGLFGLLQLIRGKSLGAVDREIYCLAGLYVITLALYVLFNKVVINYRPEILPDETGIEASFPSSHTVLAFVIFGSASYMLSLYMEKNTTRFILTVLLDVLIFLTAFGRLISGVHWFTDILGGVFLSVFLVKMFISVCEGDK